MSQIEVTDLSLKEPDLSMVVKQIYLGGLKEATPEPEAAPLMPA